MKQPRKILLSNPQAFELRLLDHILAAEGFLVCASVSSPIASARDERPDLILHVTEQLDSTTVDLVSDLRSHPSTKASLFMVLYGASTELARLRVLEAGADEVLDKSCAIPELIQRIRVLLRRLGEGDDSTEVRAGDILLNLSARSVRRGSRTIMLAPLEAKLLHFMMNNRDRLISRQELVDRVWGQNVLVDTRTVDVAVNRLRRNLNVNGELDPIRTVHGQGYSFGVSNFARLRSSVPSRAIHKLSALFASLPVPSVVLDLVKVTSVI